MRLHSRAGSSLLSIPQTIYAFSSRYRPINRHSRQGVESVSAQRGGRCMRPGRKIRPDGERVGASVLSGWSSPHFEREKAAYHL